MCALLKKEDISKPPECRPMTESLMIAGKSYRNSAAKFWPSLLDEILADFSSCSRIEFNALTSGELEWRHLYPQLALRNQGHLEASTIREEMNNAIAELELFGQFGLVGDGFGQFDHIAAAAALRGEMADRAAQNLDRAFADIKPKAAAIGLLARIGPAPLEGLEQAFNLIFGNADAVVHHLPDADRQGCACVGAGVERNADIAAFGMNDRVADKVGDGLA